MVKVSLGVKEPARQTTSPRCLFLKLNLLIAQEAVFSTTLEILKAKHDALQLTTSL